MDNILDEVTGKSYYSLTVDVKNGLEDQMEKQGVVVLNSDLTLVKKSGNTYDGVWQANLKEDGVALDCSFKVQVTYDGKSMVWERALFPVCN